MVLKNMENDSMILCPLVDRLIDPVDCMENRDIKDVFVPQEYKAKEDWKTICKNCPYHEY